MKLPIQVFVLCSFTIALLASPNRTPGSAPSSSIPPDHDPDCPAPIPADPTSPTPWTGNSKPQRPTRRLGFAGLLLAGAAGAGVAWRIRRHHLRRRRKRRLPPTAVKPRHAAPTQGPPNTNTGAPPAGRHRVRRFDYDRFYLHLLRDL